MLYFHCVNAEDSGLHKFVKNANQVSLFGRQYLANIGESRDLNDFQQAFSSVEIPDELDLLNYVKNNASDFWVERYLDLA